MRWWTRRAVPPHRRAPTRSTRRRSSDRRDRREVSAAARSVASEAEKTRRLAARAAGDVLDARVFDAERAKLQTNGAAEIDVRLRTFAPNDRRVSADRVDDGARDVVPDFETADADGGTDRGDERSTIVSVVQRTHARAHDACDDAA